MALRAVEDSTMTTVGDRIVSSRKAKDMTQLDLSKRLGISRAAVGQWEINSTSPSIAKLEEVASILGVAPEWLAYNVTPGAVKTVYRNPERDNIHWVPELTFGDSADDVSKGDIWGVPAEYLIRELRADPDNTAICVVNSHAVEPEFEYGDKVFVDRSDVKPSPAGTFAFWDGIGLAFGKIQAIPGSAEPTIRISQKGQDSYDILLSEATIIGRVKGRVQRG